LFGFEYSASIATTETSIGTRLTLQDNATLTGTQTSFYVQAQASRARVSNLTDPATRTSVDGAFVGASPSHLPFAFGRAVYQVTNTGTDTLLTSYMSSTRQITMRPALRSGLQASLM
jgi:hypothetical protein